MNLDALERTIEAMRAGDLIKDSDEALVEALRGLAAAVDTEPLNASLWREYRAALSDLRELSNGGGDAFDELIDWLRTPVRDSAH